MEQRIICIIAGQRAGTTALQTGLRATRKVKNYSEIFQTRSDAASEGRRTFHAFARENGVLLADTMAWDGAGRVAQRYLDWLRDGAGDKHVLIDVKLNSWLALSPAWAYPHDEPFFMARLKRERALFIFLWRRNLAEQILSMFISRELGVWHNLSPEKVGDRKIVAPVRRMERLAALLCRSEADMREHLAGYGDTITMAYEDAYTDGALSPVFRTAIEARIELVLPAGSLRIRPNAVPKRDIISNYDEVVTALSAIAKEWREGAAIR